MLVEECLKLSGSEKRLAPFDLSDTVAGTHGETGEECRIARTFCLSLRRSAKHALLSGLSATHRARLLLCSHRE